MKSKKSIVSSLSAFLLTPILNAAIVVDFTTNSGTTDSRAADIDTLTGDTWNFSATTALINDTTLQAGESNKRVYGGATTTWSSSQSYAPNHRILDTTTDRLQLQVNPTTSGTSAKGVWLWNKADFLNGFNSGTLSIGAGDSLSLDLLSASGGSTTTRFVVNQAGTYYVSNDFSASFAAHTFSIADMSTQTWAALNTTDYTFGSFSPVALNDVQGVGIFFTLAPAGINQSIYNITDFQLNVIPEPSVTLLGGIGVLALIRRRRTA